MITDETKTPQRGMSEGHSASGTSEGHSASGTSKEGHVRQQEVTRHSSGIALCKRGSDGIVRLLMINRRYTYPFYMFVRGRYNEHNDKEIIALLDRMTVDEKVDILSLNFQQLWYRIWLGTYQSSIFYAARSKFLDRIAADNGVRIKSLVRRSHKYAARLWEIPKGRKKFPNECDMDCAIREFYEETGIPRSAYHITGNTFHLVFTEDNVRYSVMYFIAVSARDVIQRINSAALEQVTEICDMRWISAAEMDVYAPRDVAGHRRVIRCAKGILKNPFKNPALRLFSHSNS